ncbi:LytR/AlgR family response regulator transcription factor [Granulicella tundricola]|uniref:Two component transcriptional regulator, LytTR family n=1 Tax=Granulicella tundricola (strain ATCC BAA-1859 / DSM 23138 / MP5ACTX9) TaxID=1198114 RepID=E8X841_GRATM|nr:LytTR family DNA-binding domain-containing protein [Granulicella tundricola]ADW71625.1 two component transcriptional regulator, LytTR family [Granulicella tundricola MP5ACTX9]
MTIRALIVEDEPLAIDRLRSCLAYASELDLVGEARNGAAAVEMIDRFKPDLVFLDIQLPILSGFEVLRSVEYRPAVIFTTAHDEYAVPAFEWGAFDYLLKPFDKERVALALSRFQERSGLSDGGVALVERLDTMESKGALQRFFVKQRGVTIPVDSEHIVAILAEGDYCRVHLENENHLVHLPLREFENRLSSVLFRRVHRSALINIAKVVRIEASGRGANVSMQGGVTAPASRSGLAQLKSLRL